MRLLLILSLLCQQATAFVVHQSNLHGPSSFSNNVLAARSQGPAVAGQRIDALFMFGGLFGGDDKKKDEDGELAMYRNLASSDVKFNSLSDYIQKWSQLFETDPKGMRLTTLVKVLPSNDSSGSDDEDVVAFNGVRLVFKSIDTGYKSKTEEGDAPRKKTEGDDSKKKKKKEKLQGGVEILVEKLSSGEIRVRARRCDLDEDTMIKEMSETAIIKELQTAIDVWKKEK
jgi:hypothetical protein